MKDKLKYVNPLFLILCAVMLIMSLVSLSIGPAVFVIEILLSAISIAAVVLGIRRHSSYATRVLKSTEKGIKLDKEEVLLKFGIPMFSVSKRGTIVWSNTLFVNKVNGGEQVIGKNIKEITGDVTAPGIIAAGKADIHHKGKRFTCFGIEVDDIYIFYMLEDTHLKETAEKYDLTRPCIATILFDNKEELLRDSEDEQVTQIVALVENTLQKWASGTTGFFKKISDDRYLFVTEEKFIKEFEKEKFSILNQIHEIKRDEHNFATISIGIGRAAQSLRAAELWSKKALNMALGRGGDQVVIKNNDDYSFFGGTAKGIEKRDMVRARVIASMLIEHVSDSDKVFIMGHKFSDLDCVGAALGLYSAIQKGMGKRTYIVVDRNKTLSKVLIDNIAKSTDEKIFITPDEALDLHDKDSLLIVVDTHTPGFVESSELYEHLERVVVIDHHRMMVNRIKNALIFYHEPYASSCSEMVTELVQYMGEDNIERIDAEALLAGIMLDTKNFVLRTGTRTFEAAAFLRSKGADTVEVKRMFSNSIDEYKTRFEIVSQSEIFNSCAVACTEEVGNDIRVVAAQAADELLGIQGVKASFVLYPIDNGVNISARSFGMVNVQLIMEQLGGGGHHSMAGAQIYNVSMTKAREQLIDLLNTVETNDLRKESAE